jgi:hypothetical protein
MFRTTHRFSPVSKFSTIQSLFSLFALLVSLNFSEAAAHHVPLELNATVAEIAVAPGDAPGELAFLATSTGSRSEAFGIAVTAPQGSKIRVQVAASKDSSGAPTEDASRWWSMPLLRPGNSEFTNVITTRGNFALGEEDRILGVIHKNSCDRGLNSYFVSILIDVSGIDPAITNAGYTVKIRGAASAYSGRGAGSIKPVSDGKFAPQPLLLMESIGNPELVYVTRWRGNRLVQTRLQTIRAYAFYRGLRLSRVLIANELNNRKGSVTVYDGNDAYGACFTMSRTRQCVNDYPCPRPR